MFPAQKVSFEAQRERKAGAGQTLTALGSYWKGRKPLILVRAIVLGSLLPQTDDAEKDLEIFEKLMAFDEGGLARREPKLKPADIAERVALAHPWRSFSYSLKGQAHTAEEIDQLQFPIDLDDYPGLSLRWRRDIEPVEKLDLLAKALATCPTYEERAGLCKRPEELDQAELYAPIWPAVNAHLGRFGIDAHSHQQLVEQLGILRYGHRPKVGDTFCGGGSIPFEAARLGCRCLRLGPEPHRLHADLGGAEHHRRIAGEARRDRAGAARGRRGGGPGDHRTRHRARQQRQPRQGVSVLPGDPLSGDRLDGADGAELGDFEEPQRGSEAGAGSCQQSASISRSRPASRQPRCRPPSSGTVRDGNLVYELDGKTYLTPIKTIRGDYRDADGNTANRLRRWEQHDFKPRPDDIFQERLYCIQWMTRETLDSHRPETFFAAVTDEDLERERKVENIVAKNLERWQEAGLIPDMEIEPGDKTDEPIRTRGWTYWHQLFGGRSLLGIVVFRSMIASQGGDSHLSAKVPMVLDIAQLTRVFRISH